MMAVMPTRAHRSTVVGAEHLAGEVDGILAPRIHRTGEIAEPPSSSGRWGPSTLSATCELAREACGAFTRAPAASTCCEAPTSWPSGRLHAALELRGFRRMFALVALQTRFHFFSAAGGFAVIPGGADIFGITKVAVPSELLAGIGDFLGAERLAMRGLGALPVGRPSR